MAIQPDIKWIVLLVGGILFETWFFPTSVSAQNVKQSPLMTRWAGEVSATNAHPEYPRPTMVRPDWLNLNGLWDFGITSRTQANNGAFSNKILVPFPEESLLSGTKHLLITEKQRLWYRRKFNIPKEWSGQQILLHFEAVDWETKVWVNGQDLGTHQGGYDRFSFEITDALNILGEQEVVVSVFDPTDSGFQPRGKQMLHSHPPFFSAFSGIWQTVWLEPVASTSVESLKLVPDIDAGALTVTVMGRGETNGIAVEAVALDGRKKVSHAKASLGEKFQLPVPNAKLWSPDNPFLYDLKVTLLRNGKKVDAVSGYFGMRKISMVKDENGFPRLMLNNKRLFQLGPLDQGYWPEGINTAPTDEALCHDIEVMKQLGFNMCRKHVKIEPERWYYWCDKLGLLVWQDMPNGDRPATREEKEIQRKPDSARLFETELKQMIVGRGNHPCIVIWIPFNQGWGQYDTARITSFVKELDSSRLVISASGGHDVGGGDVCSLHQYPGPAKPVHDGRRACVLGECGGLGLVVSGHVGGRLTPRNTTFYHTTEKLAGAYGDMISSIQTLKDKDGLAAAVITQLTDVEDELNGFMTYDRAIIKMPTDMVSKLNKKLLEQTGESSAKDKPIDPTSTGQ